MDLKQLATFVQVADSGGFTQAAAVLGVAQPALSRQVRSLEVELRQPLFHRNGRGVTLTASGQRLLAHSRGILQQVQRARQDLEVRRGEPAGPLSIGLPPSISRTLTAPLVEAFRAKLPKVTLSVVEGLSTYMLEWLVQGRIDCAVVYNAAPNPQLEIHHLAEEALHLVSVRQGAQPSGPPRGPLGPPASLAEVAACALVIPGQPHALRMRLEQVLAEHQLRPRVALEVDSVNAMLDLVQRHPLHAVLTLNALIGSAHEHTLAARPIHLPSGEVVRTRLWMAASSQRPLGPALEHGMQVLANIVRNAVTR